MSVTDWKRSAKCTLIMSSSTYLQLKTNLYQVYQRQAEQRWNHETTLSVHRHRLVYAQESGPRESLVTQSRHTLHRWDPTKTERCLRGFTTDIRAWLSASPEHSSPCGGLGWWETLESWWKDVTCAASTLLIKQNHCSQPLYLQDCLLTSFSEGKVTL